MTERDRRYPDSPEKTVRLVLTGNTYHRADWDWLSVCGSALGLGLDSPFFLGRLSSGGGISRIARHRSQYWIKIGTLIGSVLHRWRHLIEQKVRAEIVVAGNLSH